MKSIVLLFKWMRHSLFIWLLSYLILARRAEHQPGFEQVDSDRRASLSIADVNSIFPRRKESYSFTHILTQTLCEGSQQDGWYFFYLCFKLSGSGSPGKELSLNPECNSFQKTHKWFRAIRLEKSHFWALVRQLGKVRNDPLFQYKWTENRMGTEGEKSFPL